jgi:hypothetical protein
MKRRRPGWQRIFVSAALGILAVEASATAADLPSKAPALKAVYDWTGFYVGGHFGYGDASFGGGTNPLLLQGAFATYANHSNVVHLDYSLLECSDLPTTCNASRCPHETFVRRLRPLR